MMPDDKIQIDNSEQTIRVSKAQLQYMNKLHREELKKISKMTERQFQAFKYNFSLGYLENITKNEAQELLRSMLALNLHLQQSCDE